MQAGPEAYGSLLSAIGAGAIVGAFALAPLKERLGPDRLVAWGSFVTAGALLAFAFVRETAWGLGLCFLAGSAWILVLATLYVSVQVALPDWVRGRGLAIFLSVIFGAMTCGGAIWGEVAQAIGLPGAHVAAAAGVALAVPLTWRWKIQTGAAADFSPSRHWRIPDLKRPVGDGEGPVLVVVEYRVAPADAEIFNAAIRELGHERKRDGAYAWSSFLDPTDPSRRWETFTLASWLETRHFCERITNQDRLQEEKLRAMATSPPIVTFMIASH